MALSMLSSPCKLRSNDANVGHSNILTANPSTPNLATCVTDMGLDQQDKTLRIGFNAI